MITENKKNHIEKQLKEATELEVLGLTSYSILSNLLEEETIVDWDGKEPLRRNYRVRWKHSTTPRLVVAVNHKNDQVVTISESNNDTEFRYCPKNMIFPIKSDAEKLIDKFFENNISLSITAREHNLLNLFAEYMLADKG